MCILMSSVYRTTAVRITSSRFLTALFLETSVVAFHRYSKVSVLIFGQVKILLYVLEVKPAPELMFNVGDGSETLGMKGVIARLRAAPVVFILQTHANFFLLRGWTSARAGESHGSRLRMGIMGFL